MLSLALTHRLLSPDFMRTILASMILSMLLAPLLISYANTWVRKPCITC